MKKEIKNETEEKMDLLETKGNNNNIYKLQKKLINKEEDKLDDLDNMYEKYRVEDIDFISQSSSDDIETKMNKMIEIKKKGGNLQEYLHNKEMSKFQQMKISADKFQQQKDKKQQQKKEEKLMKMKKGLDKLKIIIPKLMRNLAYRKLTKKIKYKMKIISGFEKFKNFYLKRTKTIKTNNFKKFLKFSDENRMKRKIEKLAKEKKEKERKEKEEKEKKEKEEKERKEKEEKEKKEKEKQEKLLKEKQEKEKRDKSQKEQENEKNIEEDSKVNDNEKKDTKVKIKKITLSSDIKIEENKADNKVEKKNNIINKMPVLNEKGKKISTKKEKLEVLKKKEESFYNKVNLQSKRKFEEMKIIEEQLEKQKQKINRLKEGLNVSDTESNISYSLDQAASIEKGLKYLSNFYTKQLYKIFLINLKQPKKKNKKKKKQK